MVPAYILLAFIVGSFTAWVYLRHRESQLAAQLADQRVAAAGTETRLQSLARELAERDQRLSDTDQELRQERQRALQFELKLKEVETAAVEQQKAHERQLALLNEAESKLKDSFGALAAEALQRNNEAFLHVAETKLSEKQTAGKLEVEALVKPLADSLQHFQTQVQAIETKREGAYADIKSHVEHLRNVGERMQSEASRLATALRSTDERGNWGQLQLRNAVQMAGMLRYCDFEEQVSVIDIRGEQVRTQRPDMIIRLPNGGTIVVDAKVPLTAYLDAVACSDEKEREKKFKDYAKQVRGHVDALAKKSYWSQFAKSPDVVVAFIPGEAYTSAALQHDASLMHDSVESGVLIATPITLIGLLKAVAYGWRQEEVAENANKIAALGGELYARVATLLEYVNDLGKGLSSSLRAYNNLVGNVEGRVLVTARKFKDSGVQIASELPEPKPLELFPRPLNAPEAALIPHVAAAAAGDAAAD